MLFSKLPFFALVAIISIILPPVVIAAANSFYAGAEVPDYNNQVISSLLTRVSSIRQPGEAYAIFDWDNTCMYGDISYTSILYQVENLNFRIPPSKFQDIFSLGYSDYNGDECLPQGINTVLGQDIAKQNVTIAEVISSVAKDYEQVYNSYIAPTFQLPPSVSTVTVPLTLDQVKETQAFKDFRAKIGFLTFGLEASYGVKERLPCAMVIGMTIFPKLLYGMNDKEIRSLIRDSMRFNLKAALDTPSFVSMNEIQVKGEFQTGLRIFNGEEAVMRALRAQNVTTYVISASPQIFVEEAGAFFGLTYEIPPTNIYGVRFQFDQDKKFTAKLVDDGYPITWGPGKAEIVENYLKKIHFDQAPIFGTGDANGDCDMLDTVRDGVVHVNNRLKSAPNCIASFYEKACFYKEMVETATEPQTNNQYLMQGQDKGIGSWIKSGFTTKDGFKFTSGTKSDTTCLSYRILP